MGDVPGSGMGQESLPLIGTDQLEALFDVLDYSKAIYHLFEFSLQATSPLSDAAPKLDANM